MKIENELILKLEKLSKLELSDEERIVINKDLVKILDMVEKLQSLDTDGVEPLRYISQNTYPPRKDQIASMDIKDKALDISPKRYKDFIAIPKVIDK